MTDLSTVERRGVAADPSRAGGGSLLRRAFGNRRFAGAFAVLLAAAAAFNFFVQYRGISFRKEAVPMRLAFKDALPPDLVIGNDWVQVAQKDVLEEDTLGALGTDKYLFCNYVKASAISMTPQQVLDAVKGRSFAEQEKWLADACREHPEAMVSLALTYYTGSVDTVPHIPERCYWGSGLDQVASRDQAWAVKSGITSEAVPVRSLTFVAPSGLVQHVTYFFQANGRYTNDSLDVRETLANLFERRAYFAKIELLSVVKDDAAAQKSMTDFMNAALPKVENALPDWSKPR